MTSKEGAILKSNTVIIKAIDEMRGWSERAKQDQHTTALVPTMGALHEGHLSLIRLAQQKADRVIVSIFINPLQFGPKEDFKNYPRTLEKDIDVLTRSRTDVLFLPRVEEIYPQGFQTKIVVSNLSQYLCGKSRPGHFEGVATVVLKLFEIIKPDLAIFGDKDYQQRLMIQKMVSDLHLNIPVLGAPTVREADGLAMSSRNAYLSASERKRARVLNLALKEAFCLFRAGERDVKKLESMVSKMIDKETPEKLDYTAVCDLETLEPLKIIQDKALLAAAVTFGTTRLIDNVILSVEDETR